MTYCNEIMNRVEKLLPFRVTFPRFISYLSGLLQLTASSFVILSLSLLLLIQVYCFSVTEVTMATDLQVRGLKKTVFRRLTCKPNILNAKDLRNDAKSVLVKLKKAFTAFEEPHDVVCAPITDFDDK